MLTSITSILRRPHIWLGGLALAVAVTPVMAQSANFDGITLSASSPKSASVEGRTVGSFALSNIADSDAAGNICTGYGDPNPDHILALESDFQSLTITVDSGQDTTLLIQGPNDNTVYCGQDISRSNLDAQITAEDLQAGTYRIWVGSHGRGQRFSYTLTVAE